MSKQKKFYVVWEGVQPGVYTSWAEASEQVQGFTGAKYKSFGSRAEADKAFKGNYWAYAGQNTSKDAKSKSGTPAPKSLADLEKIGIHLDSLAVDAACSGNPGRMEYRGVHIRTGQQIFHLGPFEDGTNNVGEFLALVHGLAWLAQHNRPRVPIYSDSRNAQIWVKAGQCRTKLERTGRNDDIFELISRAERWLASHKITNPIVKWETDQWGEIPADFGRK